MQNKPNEQSVSSWVSLVRAYQTAMNTVETALKEANFPPLNWYDVLLELEKVSPSGLRLIELEKKLLIAQYGISRLASKMEANGLIARRQCPDDKRSQIVELTDKGRTLRQDMWPVYSSAVQRSIGSRLTNLEAETLTEILNKIILQKRS
ncbi:MarR family transcriptional regulator [Sneathiella sp. P13V-1]|uniref:MarR family winged helix-turn-helix transcriptional regulator n=1 Tax=Sneathiella sp. P13V-1 TaxID=2697366 RepID=UPI00187B571B|nr:MarR family winged helix-turn-helix transcriptional regulator [Sneathiella sp. P13V-1]MBE7635401.1 MarR family transcriptional regulator [Sneathiella sp. P13V-1]